MRKQLDSSALQFLKENYMKSNFHILARALNKSYCKADGGDLTFREISKFLIQNGVRKGSPKSKRVNKIVKIPINKESSNSYVNSMDFMKNLIGINFSNEKLKNELILTTAKYL